jgi:AAA15 family ATPase/GTPase
LEVKGLGQVNMIGGKNNVGKTAFLEAVELLLSPHKASGLAFVVDGILKRRQNETKHCEIDFFYNNQNSVRISSDSKCCQIKWDITEEEINSIKNIESSNEVLRLSFTRNHYISDDVSMCADEFPLDLDTHSSSYWRPDNGQFSYISSTKYKEQDIAILLGKLIDLDREDFLNQSIALFDANIISIKQILTEQGLILKLKQKNQNGLVLLSSLGEGVNRYIAILCAIWANKDGFLLIDEIENGIHFSNYPKLWEIIFKTSVEANCQLFITTHSKECITAFNDMQFEIENCNAQYFEFYKNLKTDLIVASSRDKEQLRYALTHEGRVRGE